MRVPSLPIVVAVTALITGCRGQDGTTVAGVPVDAGAECANGGVTFQSGIDANGDGTLSADEIDQEITICNGTDGAAGTNGTDGTDGADGADGAALLVSSTTLAQGDENCTFGGIQLDAGLDNGDGGETADDGVLGVGEIDTTEYVCNGEDSVISDSPDAPAGAVGTGRIDVSGGDNISGAGGDGGEFQLGMDWANSGYWKIFETGQADASFTIPTFIPDYGTNPLTISSDTTIIYDDGSTFADGTLVYRPSSNRLVKIDSTNGDEVITGIEIEAGVTVTIDGGSFEDASVSTMNINFARDVVVRGSLVISDGLDIVEFYSGNFWVDSAGTFVVEDATLSMYALVTWSPFDLHGAIVIDGTVDGSPSGIGESARSMSFYAESGIYLTGTIDNSGGPGDASNQAGNGGSIALNPGSGPVYSSGEIRSVGGDDGGAGAGYGGGIDIMPQQLGEVRISGVVDASGGARAGGGGNVGGDIEIGAYGYPLIIDAEIRSTSSTGTGGYIELWSWDADDWWGNATPTGRVDISGVLDVSGQDGTGADGGKIWVGNGEAYGTLRPVTFYGIAMADLSGGDGTGSLGGDGGEGMFYMDQLSPQYMPPQYMVVDTDFDLSGGKSTGGVPGDGGTFFFSCTDEDNHCGFIGRGDIDLSGGDAGRMEIYGSERVEISGNIDASGAPDGWDGGSVVVASAGRVDVSGQIDVSGSPQASAGGSAGKVSAFGGEVYVSGDLLAGGGDADTTSGEGGAGGTLDLVSFAAPTSLTSTTVDIAGGTGAVEGIPGHVGIDGGDQSGNYLP